MTKRVALLAVAVSLGIVSSPAWAGSFDGNQGLVCTFESVAECDTDALCATVSAADIDLPDSISVDFKASRLRSPDGQRTSPIGSIEVSEATLIAQGNQNGRGWSMAIDRETGRMTATIAETAGAMVLSGSCEKAP